ncbi:MAG: amidohydrolase family protein, partial [Alphaproteobacteria bacterium]|nr:amidohydrolase family protein [Alphaproteobacteria bacterium]
MAGAHEYDLIIRNGFVVDGSGLPRRRVDVGIKDGRIAKLAHLEGHAAAEEIDAAGLIVAPGIVDAHTHYDPQITFDPYATTSCYHGVTTIMAGNCGFSVAPCKREDREFLAGIFARVEDMDPIAMSGITWDEFTTFRDFLESRKGKLGVNFACYIGHSNLRRWVMGEDAIKRAATDAEIEAMCGMVVDGSGLPRRRVDVGIKDGKIAKLAHLEDRSAPEEIDATGLIIAPGIVDAHTHYDPQITFDPYATVSCFHGVTTVVAGNCGFSVAPVKKQDREFLAGIFARVEDMDPIAMSGITWDEFTTFKEFLDSRAGKLGVNFACYIGHSNLRRWVMGDDAIKRAATDDEIAQMCAMVRDAMAAGAAGFSSSMAPTHLDIHDRPVPSRLAEKKEVLALVTEVGKAGHGSIAFLPSSAIGGITKEDQEYLIEIGQASGLPVIIQGLGGRNKVDAPTATWEASQIFLDDAVRRGGPVFSLLIARPFDRSLVIGPANLHYRAVPSWMRMLNLPEPERAALLRDAHAREELRTAVENYN